MVYKKSQVVAKQISLINKVENLMNKVTSKFEVENKQVQHTNKKS